MLQNSRHPSHARVRPMQLALFSDPPPLPAGSAPMPAAPGIALTRIRPERNEWRFYRLDLQPDLFGQICVVREWGRPGRVRLDRFLDAARAAHALDRLATAKRRRGYRDVA